MKLSYTIRIGPRPGKKSKQTINEDGVTHILTLLSVQENAAISGNIAKELNATWLHFPIAGGKLETLEKIEIPTLFNCINEAKLCDNSKLYIHCSAGIHRTGFIAYLLLRQQGHSDDSAKLELAQIRQVTADQVGEHRLLLAKKMYESMQAQT